MKGREKQFWERVIETKRSLWEGSFYLKVQKSGKIFQAPLQINNDRFLMTYLTKHLKKNVCVYLDNPRKYPHQDITFSFRFGPELCSSIKIVAATTDDSDHRRAVTKKKTKDFFFKGRACLLLLLLIFISLLVNEYLHNATQY